MNSDLKYIDLFETILSSRYLVPGPIFENCPLVPGPTFEHYSLDSGPSGPTINFWLLDLPLKLVFGPLTYILKIALWYLDLPLKTVLWSLDIPFGPWTYL